MNALDRTSGGPGISRPESAVLRARSDTQGGDVQLERARRAAERGEVRETARQFETLFATQLVRELRRAIPGGIFGEGAGADVFEGWFDEHLGNALGERETLGIAELVRSSLLRAQAAREDGA
jgi:flagellar protein FlgJ